MRKWLPWMWTLLIWASVALAIFSPPELVPPEGWFSLGVLTMGGLMLTQRQILETGLQGQLEAAEAAIEHTRSALAHIAAIDLATTDNFSRLHPPNPAEIAAMERLWRPHGGEFLGGVPVLISMEIDSSAVCPELLRLAVRRSCYDAPPQIVVAHPDGDEARDVPLAEYISRALPILAWTMVGPDGPVRWSRVATLIATSPKGGA